MGGKLTLAFIAASDVRLIGAMIAIALAFAIFLIETRLGSRSVRIRTDILEHEVEADESP